MALHKHGVATKATPSKKFVTNTPKTVKKSVTGSTSLPTIFGMTVKDINKTRVK